MVNNYLYNFLTGLGVGNFAARNVVFVVETPTKILVILVLAAIASRLAARGTRRAISSLGSRTAIQARYRRAPGRANALGSSLAGLTRVVIWAITIPIVLSEIGLNLGPLIAGATIIGAALGFGAQSLVKDLLSGFLILSEDQFAAGDSIVVGLQSGTVEDVNLLRTRIRADDGKVWFIANGEIRTVANASLEWGQAIVDVLVSLDSDLDVAIAAARREADAFAAEAEWVEVILAPPQAYALAATPDGITLRVTARTPPARSTAVARALLPRVSRQVRAALGVHAVAAEGDEVGGSAREALPVGVAATKPVATPSTTPEVTPSTAPVTAEPEGFGDHGSP